MRYLFLAFATFLLLVSCKSYQKTGSDVEVKSSQKQQKDDLQPFYCNDIQKVMELPDSTKYYHTTTILDYQLVKSCVCIKYQYSGCKKGKSTLVWDGKFHEDPRPKVMMKLLIEDAGNCDQIITDSTCFSLKDMALVGNQVLIYLNSKENDLLVNFEGDLK